MQKRYKKSVRAWTSSKTTTKSCLIIFSVSSFQATSTRDVQTIFVYRYVARTESWNNRRTFHCNGDTKCFGVNIAFLIVFALRPFKPWQQKTASFENRPTARLYFSISNIVHRYFFAVLEKRRRKQQFDGGDCFRNGLNRRKRKNIRKLLPWETESELSQWWSDDEGGK